MKYCPSCGQEVQETMRFCPSCGTKLTDAPGDSPVQPRHKRKKKKHLVLKIFLIVILLAALAFGGLIVYTYHHYYMDVDPFDGLTPEGFKESCAAVSYADLSHYPDQYTGAHIKISGEVVQAMGDGIICEYRIATGSSYDDVVYCIFNRQEGDPRLVEGDTVTIYGLGQGLYTYEAVSGASITLPLVLIAMAEF